jgi:pyruvate kinase
MTANRRVRIVATLGPATDQPGVLAALCRAGLDVARINLSHGAAEEPERRVHALREAAQACGRTVAVLADLPGPKLRVLLSAARTLVAGERIVFAEKPVGDELGVTEPELFSGIQPGHRILLDDGRLQLRAESASSGRVEATVLIGGVLSPKKGINLPDSPMSIPSVTARDLAALKLAAGFGPDWLALSFVRGPEAADELRWAAKAVGLNVPVLAKIERPEAIDKLPHIVAAFDGLMVARGDLGVEIPLERVPVLQKRVIAEARAHGKPVITATDMLDSMRNSPRPTRAEASDVANSVYDGTDAVMLSGETAVGNYPVEAVECMDRIVRQTEIDLNMRGCFAASFYSSLDDEVAAAFCRLAEAADAQALIVPTMTGRTARQVARHRPRIAIIAPVPTEAVRRQLALVWGVTPVPLRHDLANGADRIDAAVRAAVAAAAIQPDQRVLVVAGHPIEGGRRLPTIRLVKVGPGGESLEP